MQNLYDIMILVDWNPENIDYPLFPNLGAVGIMVYDTITVPCSVFYLVPVIYMALLSRCWKKMLIYSYNENFDLSELPE